MSWVAKSCLPLVKVDAVQDQIRGSHHTAAIFGWWMALSASSTDSGWKWKTSLRMRPSSGVGDARSTQKFTFDDGSSQTRIYLVDRPDRAVFVDVDANRQL